jgi:hypothetical protein
MATPDELVEEAHRARKLRQLVDIAASVIRQSAMTRGEAERLVTLVRSRVLALFPDGASAYELIYAPRFRRLIDEFSLPAPHARGSDVPTSRDHVPSRHSS